MPQSLLFATHLALSRLLWDHSIWNIYAYVPGDKMYIQPRWKIKTRKWNSKSCKYSFDSLKYYDIHDEKLHAIAFNFGWREREHIPTIAIPVLQLQYEYKLEREIVEKICQLSDEGHMVVSNNETIMDKFKGSEFLVGIDLEAPSHADLNVKNWPF